MNDDKPTPPTPDDHPEANDRPEPTLPGKLALRDVFEALLRSPRGLTNHPDAVQPATLVRLAGIALGSMLVFGLVLGTFAFGGQLWAAPLKLVLGLAFAGLICFPSLYIFSSLAGSSATAGRLASALAGTLALAGLLLLGIAPALWIFAQGVTSLGFMGFLALAAWAVALAFGMRFLFAALKAHGAAQRGPLSVWVCVFVLVSLQLPTSLRPILGRSDEFLTTRKKFFLAHWIESMGETLDPTR